MASYSKYETVNGVRWRASFRAIEDGRLKQKTLRGYKTKREAEKAYVDYMKNYVPQVVDKSEANTVTVSKAIDAYSLQQEMRVKESSIVVNASKLRMIKEKFGDKIIAEITPADLLQWQTEIMRKYQSAYAIEIRKKFNTIIRFAHKFYGSPDDLIDAVAMPRFPEKEKEEMHIITEEQYKHVREFIQPQYKLYFDFLFLSGCRKAEAIALQVEDVDYAGNRIHIRQSLTRRVKNGGYKLTTPKNPTSVRWISIPPYFMEKIKQATKGINKGFVFSRQNDGKVPFCDTSLNYEFTRALKVSGTPQIRIHDIRHSHASMLISQGVSIVAVSRRLGHKDIRETLNTYSHMLPEDAEKIDNILKNFSL